MQTFMPYGSAYDETARRGYKDTVLESSKELMQKHQVPVRGSKPEWIDNPALTITHRANLYLKDPLHYIKFEDEVKEYMDYVCCPDKCKYWWYVHTL